MLVGGGPGGGGGKYYPAKIKPTRTEVRTLSVLKKQCGTYSYNKCLYVSAKPRFPDSRGFLYR